MSSSARRTRYATVFSCTPSRRAARTKLELSSRKMRIVALMRDTDELYREVYPELGHPDGDWQELREYYCPLSGRLLETEAVPPGYPVIHEYLPDLEGFYKGWLGRPMP